MLTSLRNVYYLAEHRAHTHIQETARLTPSTRYCKVRYYGDRPTHVIRTSWKHQVRIAKGENEASILRDLEPLLMGRDGGQQQRWQLCLDGQSVRRKFHFKTFRNTWVWLHAQLALGSQAIADKSKEFHASRCRRV